MTQPKWTKSTVKFKTVLIKRTDPLTLTVSKCEGNKKCWAKEWVFVHKEGSNGDESNIPNFPMSRNFQFWKICRKQIGNKQKFDSSKTIGNNQKIFK